MADNDSWDKREELYEVGKLALAVRTARTALNMNQVEFAEMMEVSKPTIARIETLETPVKFSFYAKMLRKLDDRGVIVETLDSDSIRIEIQSQAVESLISRLMNDLSRRTDRKRKGVNLPFSFIQKKE
ncbi:MAG: helix-turn-helix transcriptional regulator [Marinobacter sp.]|nr:helix-turn-helix transcriptional regulator [Marinobacter sp.]MCL1481507.1 helix-turn-helix transcriptional regulator [Marinobacter sp.]